MVDHDRDPFDDRASPLRSDEQNRRLCIVSAKPLLCGPFMAALRTVLNPYDELEIIVDRRRERIPTESRADAQQASIDRRRHPQVDHHLTIDGFAIVPAPAAGLKARRSPISLLLPRMTVEEAWPEDLKEDQRLKRRRTFTRIPGLTMWLVPAGLVIAVALFAASSAVKTLLSPPGAETSSDNLRVPLTQDKQGPPEAHAPSVAPNPSEVPRPSLPEASSPMRGENAPSDVAHEFPDRASETSAAARVAPPNPATAPTQTTKVTTSTPDAAVTGTTSPRSTGLPRVEVVGNTADAWGRGETYMVRIFDPAGRPLAGAEVWLRAHMADSTVQNIVLHSGPEPGTYQANVPSGVAPVDVRVAITTSDTRVEIPVSP